LPKPTSPLKVTALAASAQPGGTERVLLDFANRAFEHDVALRVLTPREGPLVNILNKIGVPAQVVPASQLLLRGSQREGRLWTLPPALLSLAGWSRQLAAHPFVREAAVIYSVAFKTHVAATLARLHPSVWHLHEYPPTRTGWIWRQLMHRVPDRMIAVSDAVGEAWGRPGDIHFAADHAAPDEHGKREAENGKRLMVVRNGVNLDRFKPRERTGWIHDELGIPRDHRLIGMPGVFARWKGHLEVLEAFGAIAQELPDVHLVIVGGSIYDTAAEERYGATLKQATGEWETTSPSGGKWEAVEGSGEWQVPQGSGSGTEDVGESFPRVHMLPFQREIELAYPEFDVAVHYSLRPEGFGRVVVEAMACGVPIVAADEGGPREILGGGIGPRREAGWLAEPRNPAALARILRSALSLPTDVLRSVGAAGRIRAEDHFSARGFAARVAQVLTDTAQIPTGPE
jgi:glycosyltransferase involved in cell wall biosynthesis